MLDLVGLTLIVLGWLLQFLARTKTIQLSFIACYTFGVLLLVISGYLSGNYLSAGMNLVAVGLAVGVVSVK